MRAARKPASSRRRSSPWSSLATGFEAGLWMFSLAVLSIVAWMIADSYLYQLRFRDQVGGARAGRAASSQPAGSADRRSSLPPVALGNPLARLSIPRLDVSVVVAEGTTTKVLRRAVGRVASSVRPGPAENIVLAGHRDTFFRPLEHIRKGDVIFVDSEAGRQTYGVEWTRIVDPGEVGVAAASGYPALTLVTCYPFRYVGNAPQRFVVRARRLGPAD